MRKTIICFALLLALGISAHAQEVSDTNILETAYQVMPPSSLGYKVKVVIVAANPFEDKFASYPNVRVTLRAADGSIITTRDISSAGIPPKHKIAFCEELFASEQPAKVEFRSLSAKYELTEFRSSDFLPFELMNINARDESGELHVTGEIKNPYPIEAGAWITFLFRSQNGKLLGGVTKWESTIPAGEPSAFEFYVNLNEIPRDTKSIEKMIFSHNNFQRSWRQLLRR